MGLRPLHPSAERAGSELRTKTRVMAKKEINSSLGKTALKKCTLNDFAESFQHK